MSDTLQAAIEAKKVPGSKKTSVLAAALGEVKSMGGASPRSRRWPRSSATR